MIRCPFCSYLLEGDVSLNGAKVQCCSCLQKFFVKSEDVVKPDNIAITHTKTVSSATTATPVERPVPGEPVKTLNPINLTQPAQPGSSADLFADVSLIKSSESVPSDSVSSAVFRGENKKPAKLFPDNRGGKLFPSSVPIMPFPSIKAAEPEVVPADKPAETPAVEKTVPKPEVVPADKPAETPAAGKTVPEPDDTLESADRILEQFTEDDGLSIQNMLYYLQENGYSSDQILEVMNILDININKVEGHEYISAPQIIDCFRTADFSSEEIVDILRDMELTGERHSAEDESDEFREPFGDDELQGELGELIKKCKTQGMNEAEICRKLEVYGISRNELIKSGLYGDDPLEAVAPPGSRTGTNKMVNDFLFYVCLAGLVVCGALCIILLCFPQTSKFIADSESDRLGNVQSPEISAVKTEEVK